MKVASLHATERQKQKLADKAEAEQAQLNALANLELLKQELSGLAGATRYLEEFTIHGKRKFWLIPGEGLDGLSNRPERVDWLLKNLDWIKHEIKRLNL